MGITDKKFRITIGSIALLVGLYFQSWWGLLGLIPILTSLINWCPLYVPFGISTIKKNNTGDVK